jgi:hypothetical protein
VSAGLRIPRTHAADLAFRLMERWGMPADDCLVAGSIRRGRDAVGDIDLVAPMPQSRSLGRQLPDALYDAIAATVATEEVAGGIFGASSNWIGRAVRGLSPQFRACELLIEMESGAEMPVQISRYDPGPDGNCGWISVIRTGPAEFGRAFLVKWKRCHRIPMERPASRDGYLLDGDGRPVATPTEQEVFDLCRMNFISPDKRDHPAFWST